MSVIRWLVVLISGAVLAKGQDDAQLAANAQALPPQIHTVASGGYWSRGGQDGSFRLVIESVGWDELASRAFLQWIRLDHDKQQEIIERTVPIQEISGRWLVVSQNFVLRGEQWDIVIAAKRRVPPAKATFTITPTDDMSYKVTSSEK